jgi:hypothetical protein
MRSVGSAIAILGSVGITILKRTLAKGSQNDHLGRWENITVEQAKNIKLKPNQFWHGITLVDPETRSNITDHESAYSAIENMGFSVSRGAHRPQVGSQMQTSRTPDMGVYMTKKIEEARWYSYPFVSMLEIPIGNLGDLRVDEDMLGLLLVENYQFSQNRWIQEQFKKMVEQAFRRAVSEYGDQKVPKVSQWEQDKTWKDILNSMESGDINAYLNDYCAIGKFINKYGLTQENLRDINSWIQMGELDIPNFFMPADVMPRIPIKKLYLLEK